MPPSLPPERTRLVHSAMQKELLRGEQRRVLVLIALLTLLIGILALLRVAPELIVARLLVSDAVAQSLGGGVAVGEDLGLVELKGQAHKTRLFKLA